MIFLIKCVLIEYYNINIKYNKFLFERYKNRYNFNKHRSINNVNKFKRDYYHMINNIPEYLILKKIFDRNV